jgi:predicted RNA-binding protein with TRAM domain
MDISETLKTVYSARIEDRDGRYRILVPEREIEAGTIAADETYRVALLASPPNQADAAATQRPASADTEPYDGPPVSAGDRRTVDIEGTGDQGDGIAKIDQGYVLIVPETSVGDRVTVEIDHARDNVGFATVVDRHPSSV